MRSKIGIFGGTFDPPHLGHLILASEAMCQLGLDQVLWVLTPDSPFKTDIKKTPIEHRIEMVRQTISPEPCFEISLVELQRSGPHYTIDTLNILRNDHPSADLTFLMGGDSLAQFHTWHKPKQILEIVENLGVMKRPTELLDISAVKQALPEIVDKIAYINAPLLQISSTDIRNRIKNGGHFRFFLPDAVYSTIQKYDLYRG